MKPKAELLHRFSQLPIDISTTIHNSYNIYRILRFYRKIKYQIMINREKSDPLAMPWLFFIKPMLHWHFFKGSNRLHNPLRLPDSIFWRKQP